METGLARPGLFRKPMRSSPDFPTPKPQWPGPRPAVPGPGSQFCPADDCKGDMRLMTRLSKPNLGRLIIMGIQHGEIILSRYGTKIY